MIRKTWGGKYTKVLFGDLNSSSLALTSSKELTRQHISSFVEYASHDPREISPGKSISP